MKTSYWNIDYYSGCCLRPPEEVTRPQMFQHRLWKCFNFCSTHIKVTLLLNSCLLGLKFHTLFIGSNFFRFSLKKIMTNAPNNLQKSKEMFSNCFFSLTRNKKVFSAHRFLKTNFWSIKASYCVWITLFMNWSDVQGVNSTWVNV